MGAEYNHLVVDTRQGASQPWVMRRDEAEP